MWKTIDKMIEKVSKSAGLASGVVCVIAFLCVTADVALRYIFNYSLIWATDAATEGLLAVAFLAFSLVEYENRHITVDVVVNHLERRGRAAADIVAYLATTAFVGLIIWGGIMGVTDTFRAQAKTMTSHIPTWPFDSFVVIGGLMYLAAVLVNFVKKTRNLSKEAPDNS